MRPLVNCKAGYLAFVILLGLCSFTANAQTKRAKAKPLATPPPRVLTGAEIISQGGDYVDPPVSTPIEKPPAKPATTNSGRIKELSDRVNKLESAQANRYDEQQKRLLMNLDIITRAEARTESLRKQLFEMIEKESTVKSRIEQIDYDIKPEMIERTLQLSGSMKPEEVRENRKKSLEAERRNLEALVTQIQYTRVNLEANLMKAEQMVEKLRNKLEKDIDNSLTEEEPQN